MEKLIFLFIFALNSCSWCVYEAEGKVLFGKSARYLAQNGSFFCGQLPLSENIKHIRSPEIINLVVKEINGAREIEEYLSYDEFLKNIGIEIIGGTDAVSLRYGSTDKALAIKVVNTWINILNIDYSSNACEDCMQSNYSFHILDYADEANFKLEPTGLR